MLHRNSWRCIEWYQNIDSSEDVEVTGVIGVICNIDINDNSKFTGVIHTTKHEEVAMDAIEHSRRKCSK